MASPFDETHRRVVAWIPENSLIVMATDGDARLTGKMCDMEAEAVGRMLRAARIVIDRQVEMILAAAERNYGPAAVAKIQAGLNDVRVQSVFDAVKDTRPARG